jgi:hypothetical protein
MSTTSTNLASLIPSERIERRLREVNLPPAVALQIADIDSVGPGEGSKAQIVKMSDMTIPAGTTGENVEFPVITSTDSHVNIEDGLVGVSFQLSRKGSHDAIFNVLMRKVELIRKKLMLRVDQDGLNLIQSSNNIYNATGNNLTETRLTTAQIQFAAQNPSVTGTVALVATPQVIGDLKIDLQTSGGTRLGADPLSAAMAQMMGLTLGSVNGFQGVWNGVALFQTTQAPTTGTDCNAAMVIAGPESAWAYRLWNGLQIDSKWQQESWSWLVTVALRYGWGIADDEQQLELVLDNVA